MKLSIIYNTLDKKLHANFKFSLDWKFLWLLNHILFKFQKNKQKIHFKIYIKTKIDTFKKFIYKEPLVITEPVETISFTCSRSKKITIREGFTIDRRVVRKTFLALFLIKQHYKITLMLTGIHF